MDTRSRRKSPLRGNAPLAREPHGTPRPPGLSTNTGPIAAAAWLANLGVIPDAPRWYVEVTLGAEGDEIDPDVDTESPRLHIEVFAEEWGFRFAMHGKLSWIRVTDVPFVHGRDEHALLREAPPLRNLTQLVRALELRHAFRFDRNSAVIRSSIFGSEPTIRAWVHTL